MHMIGVVTETGYSAQRRGMDAEESKSFLEDVGVELAKREFVSYAEVMDILGVPADTYEYSQVKLKNGRKVFCSDPQLGWGRNGFGYYIVTFVETA